MQTPIRALFWTFIILVCSVSGVAESRLEPVSIDFVAADGNRLEPSTLAKVTDFFRNRVFPITETFKIPNVAVNISTNTTGSIGDDGATIGIINVHIDASSQSKLLDGLAAFSHEYGHSIFYANVVDPTAEHLRPFNEFFADVVAVLATKDGETMARAQMLADSQNRLIPTINNYRNFTINGSRGPGPIVESNGQFDEHKLFFAARQLVWKTFLEAKMSDQSASAILLAVLNATETEVRRDGALLRSQLGWRERYSPRAIDKIEMRFTEYVGIELQKLQRH